MTALDDLRRALYTVERWRDEATPQPWVLDIEPSGWPEVLGKDENELWRTVTETINAGDAPLIAAAVSVLLDEGSGVAAILQDAIEHYGARWEPEGWKMPDATAMRLAELVNRIEATR